MVVTEEVAYQSSVLPQFLRPLAVGDTRRLHDGIVTAHVVDNAHEAVVENFEGLTENVVEGGNLRAFQGFKFLHV